MKEKTKKLKKLLAFTLAEVLITLSILGVVAAITVPSLIKRQHRTEVETRLKKFISTLQNVVDISVAENGPMSTWTADSRFDAFEKYMMKYLNVTENHRSDANYDGQRWVIMEPDKINQVAPWFHFSTYCLKDGTCFGVTNGQQGFSRDAHGDILSIPVDINGPKGPNVAGKDMFVFHIGEIKEGIPSYTIRGQEASYQSKAYQKTKCYGGRDADYHCGGIFIDNGYKFPKDYPWL